MKKQLLLIALVLVTGLSFAQKTLSKDYSYTVSAPYKVFDARQKLYFYKDNEILTVKIDGKEIMLQKFENGEKIKFKSEKLYENVFPKHYQPEAVMEFNDKFYFFYSSWDGDNDKEQLYVREIDFKKGEFIGDNKLMFKVDGKIAGGGVSSYAVMGGFGFGMGVADKFDFQVSSDKKKMLIQYRKKPKVKRDVKSYDIIGVHAYDGDLEAKYNNELTMPYTERRMDVLDYSIDRQANTYILAKVFHDDSNDDKKRRRDKEANYHVELFRIPAGTNKIDITKIEIKDKFVNGLYIFESPGDYMVCAGFYNNGKNAKSADGMMMFKVKRDGEIYEKTFIEIPLEIINQNLSAKQRRKNEKKEKEKEEDGEGEGAEIRAFTMDKIVVENDGSIVLLGEQYYTVTHYSQKHTYTSYHYEDILVTKIDASGKLGWIKKLPKKQSGTSGQGGMSYKHFFVNNNHYVLYLDNVKNYNLPADKKPAMHSDGKGGYFTSYKIDDTTGEAKSGSVFDMRNVDDMTMYQFSVGRILEISKDEFAIEFYKKKKEDVMMKVKML